MINVNGCGAVAFPPEMKQSQKGSYLTFKLRTGKTLPDGRVIQSYTRCVMFGERAQVAAKRIEQGSIVTIQGELSTRKDDEGREWTSVRVSDLGVPEQDTAQQPKTDRQYWRDPSTEITAAYSGTPAPQYQQQPKRHSSGLVPPGTPYKDDDIPF